MDFEHLNIAPELLEGIHAMGFQSLTPIQEKAIPAILNGSDIIACAQTGTGKTAAFVLPLLHQILQLPANGVHSLIIVPTRELAVQIDQQIDAISYFIDVHSMAIYGGGSGETWLQQKRALKTGVDIIIATPGRLLAQMKMGGIDFSKLQHLVLDEADRMLDMGFYDDIIEITRHLPPKRQTLCFSATMPAKIRLLSRKILHQPQEISIAVSKPASGIRQMAYFVNESLKLPLLSSILKSNTYRTVLIFASSKIKVKQINQQLKSLSIPSKAFHSDLQQEEREKLMQDFKNKHLSALVGTDILSRGIDVEGIDLVINFNVPHATEDYIHRIGRTARAEQTGTAITFVEEKDKRRFKKMNENLDGTIEIISLPDALQSIAKEQNKMPGQANNRSTKAGFNKQKKNTTGYKKPFHQKKKDTPEA